MINNKNKVVAIALGGIMGMSTIVPISAAGVEEKLSTNVSPSKKYELNSFKDLVVRKSKEIAAGVGGTVGLLSLGGCVYQTAMKNKIAAERDEANRLRDEAIGERDKAFGERDKAIGEIDKAIDERDKAFGERDKAMGERDKAFGERDKAFGERDKAFGERDEAFGERDEAFDRIKAEFRQEIETITIQRNEAYRQLAEANRRLEGENKQPANAQKQLNAPESNQAQDSTELMNLQLKYELLCAYSGYPVLKTTKPHRYSWWSSCSFKLNKDQFDFLIDLTTGKIDATKFVFPVWRMFDGNYRTVETAKKLYVRRLDWFTNCEKRKKFFDKLQISVPIAEAFFDQVIAPNYEAIVTGAYQNIKKA